MKSGVVPVLFVALAACGRFGKEDAANETADAGDLPAADAATDAGSGCAGAILCEPFEGHYDSAWTPWPDKDPRVPSVEPFEDRTGVLVSAVKGGVGTRTAARIGRTITTTEPVVIAFDMRIEEPKFLADAGLDSNNFFVFTVQNGSTNVGLFAFDYGGLELNVPNKLASHATVEFGKWSHYELTVQIAPHGIVELTQDGTTIASGTVDAPAPAQPTVLLGTGRNNDLYDLQIEYDNLVVRRAP